MGELPGHAWEEERWRRMGESQEREGGTHGGSFYNIQVSLNGVVGVRNCLGGAVDRP